MENHVDYYIDHLGWGSLQCPQLQQLVGKVTCYSVQNRRDVDVASSF